VTFQRNTNLYTVITILLLLLLSLTNLNSAMSYDASVCAHVCEVLQCSFLMNLVMKFHSTWIHVSEYIEFSIHSVFCLHLLMLYHYTVNLYLSVFTELLVVSIHFYIPYRCRMTRPQNTPVLTADLCLLCNTVQEYIHFLEECSWWQPKSQTSFRPETDEDYALHLKKSLPHLFLR